MSSSMQHELLRVLPSDPKEQIEVASRVIMAAYTSKVKLLEGEVAKQKELLGNRTNSIRSLEKRIADLELETQDWQEKHEEAMVDQQKLVGEKNALIETVKKLNREVVKLEHFKRSLLSQLQDHGEPDVGDSDVVHDVVGDRLIDSVLTSVASIQRPGEVLGGIEPGLENGHHYDRTGTAHASRDLPTRDDDHHGKGGSKLDQVDGKDFFKTARARLSYEQFSAFLAVIKELNAGRQGKDVSLAKAKAIFGEENEDLYDAFDVMLYRHAKA